MRGTYRFNHSSRNQVERIETGIQKRMQLQVQIRTLSTISKPSLCRHIVLSSHGYILHYNYWHVLLGLSSLISQISYTFLSLNIKKTYYYYYYDEGHNSSNKAWSLARWYFHDIEGKIFIRFWKSLHKIHDFVLIIRLFFVMIVLNW